MFACSSHENITDNSDKSGGITRSWIAEFRSTHYFRFNEERKKKRETTGASRDKDEFIFELHQRKKSLTWHWSGTKLKLEKSILMQQKKG